MKIDAIIFDAAYDIAAELTGCKPTRMSEDAHFDEVFDQVQEALYLILAKQEQA